MDRYLSEFIKKDLVRKAVLLSGPRQVGKTTLANSLLGDSGQYLNYDIIDDRRIILARGWSRDVNIVVLDELHKFRKWKNLLKGEIDQFKNKPALLVTGSARLEVFRKAGDALTGRTFSYHMHPLDVAEACAINRSKSPAEHLEHLLKVGGFPESYLNPSDAPRLLRDRLALVIQDDLRDLSRVTDIKRIELLIELLRARVGAQLTSSNIANDLSTSSPTIASWINLLEKLYIIFLLRPYSRGLAKSLRKEPKCFFFDCAAATNGAGARLENVVACALQKWVDLERDSRGREVALWYYRDTEGREVDFVISEGSAVLACIEVKSSDDRPSPALHYLATRVGARYALQLVHDLRHEGDFGAIKVRRLAPWLATLTTGAFE